MKITTEKVKEWIAGPQQYRFRELFRLKFKKRDYIFGYVREENVVHELSKEVGRIAKDMKFPDHRDMVVGTKVLASIHDMPEAAQIRQIEAQFKEILQNIKEKQTVGPDDYFTRKD